MDTAPTDERLHRLSTVASRADLSLRAVYRHVEKGALKVVRVGPFRRPRVKDSELRKYLGDKPEPE